jgi:hypothetical protein
MATKTETRMALELAVKAYFLKHPEIFSEIRQTAAELVGVKPEEFPLLTRMRAELEWQE